MNEKKPPVKRYTTRVHATAPLRYVTHAAPFERDHPVASAANTAEQEKASRDRTEALREDLFDGMV